MSHHVTYYYLTMMKVEGRGSVTPLVGRRRYASGTAVKCVAKPYRGYKFSSWLIDNVLTVTVNPYTVTMSMNHVVKAIFAKGYTLDVTIDPPGAGTVTKVPDKPLYEAGEVVTLTAVPAAGQIFKAWTDNSVAKPAGPLTITI